MGSIYLNLTDKKAPTQWMNDIKIWIVVTIKFMGFSHNKMLTNILLINKNKHSKLIYDFYKYEVYVRCNAYKKHKHIHNFMLVDMDIYVCSI